MCRHIEAATLNFARYSRNPFGKAPRRGRGARAAGLRYEENVGKELARRQLDFACGPWIQFEDTNGVGFAQPDFIVYSSANSWIVLEAKLSQTPSAFEQLFKLYLPLLSKLHPGVTLIPAQVCKNLRRADSKIVDDLCKVKYGSTWHWLS